MGKKKFTYELMGAKYDRNYENPFREQETIYIEGQDLDTLEAIDAFTCDKTLYDFVKSLPEQYQDKDHFSIRITNNQKKDSYFVKTIFEHPELKEVLDGIRKEKIKIGSSYKTVSKVPHTVLVASLWRTIERALTSGDKETLDRYYHPDTIYAGKLQRFIDSAFTNEEQLLLLDELKTEFSDYSIFRKAFLDREKKYVSRPVTKHKPAIRYKSTTNYHFYESKGVFASDISLKKKAPFSDTFETIRFINNKNSAYHQEEFLDEEEMIKAGYIEEPVEPIKDTSKKRGKRG